jgi:hypothetical protein
VTEECEAGTYLFLWFEFILILFAVELLIDFQEIIGEHSGENMATAVWTTLETYDIQDKVCKITMMNY